MKRLLALFRKRSLDRELEEEIQAHLELLTEENLRRGMDPDEARLAARRSFGGVAAMQEVYREQRSLPAVEMLLQDLRYALRTLRWNPAFAAVAILTLALGIGTNTANFSVIEAVLLRPLPYAKPERLLLVSDVPDPDDGSLYKDALAWRAENRSFADMAVYYRSGGISRVTFTGAAEPDSVQGGFVSANFFPVLGVSPIRGRSFTEDEETRRERVVVLSHGLWIRRFGGADEAVGKTLQIDGVNSLVIGVMPATFHFPARSTQFWAPITTNRTWGDPALLSLDPDKSRGFYARWSVIGRLRSGVGYGEALAEVRAIGARLEQAAPDPHRGQGMYLVPLRVNLGGNMRLALLVLFGAVTCLLLIACSNVANLVLARGAARTREIAVRISLGAGRGRLVRQLFTESLVLALLAAGGALCLALFGIRGLVAFGPPDIPRLNEARIDLSVLAFTLAVTLAAAVLFGLVPAWRISQANSYTSLKAPRVGTRGLLVIAEFALSMVLLTAAGLLVRSYLAVESVDPGFRPERVLTLHVAWPGGTSSARQLQFHEQALERARAIPGVQAAGAISQLFELGAANGLGLRAIEGRELRESRAQWTELVWKAVSGDYFQAMGATLLRGRFFSNADQPGAPRVVLIDESMARRYWPREDPIGQRIKGQDRRGRDDEWVRIVGVVRDMRRQGLEKTPTAHVFECSRQSGEVPADLVVRTAGDPRPAAASLRAAVRGLDRTAILSPLITLEDQLAEQLSPRRFQTWLLGLFSVLALVLASIGIYGVMHYAVARRTHEIGLRMALGAQATDVLRLIVGQGMALALAGIAIGSAAAWGVTQLLSNLLFGVSPYDPPTFAFVSFILFAAAGIGSLIPACRALQIDALQSLRRE